MVHAMEDLSHAGPEYQGLPSWRRPPNSAASIEAQIRDDVRGECPRLRVHVQEGDATSVILETIDREACDLVVLGLGRQRPFGWPPTSKTIDQLFRQSPVSVLVVKRRPNGPYAHILVGTDFSDEARFGLEVAAASFPEATFAVMHAFDIPYRSLLLDTPLSRDFGEMERATLAEFIAEAKLPDDVRSHIVPLIEHGPPEAMLSAYAIERGADLTVIGAYERSRLFHAVVRGFGPRIVEVVPNDVLVVRAQRTSALDAAAENGDDPRSVAFN